MGWVIGMMSNQKKYLALGVIGTLLIIALVLLFNISNSGTLVLSTPNSVKGDVAVTILRNDQEEQKLTLKQGETRSLKLKKGLIRVDGSTGDIKAIDMVTIKGFSTTKLETPSGKKLGIKQLGSDAKSCPFISNTVTFSYSCGGGEGPIVRHGQTEGGNSLNTTLFNGIAFSSLYPVKNGLLGFYAATGTGTDLLFVDPVAQTITIVTLPGRIDAFLTDQPDIVVTNDPSSSRFALVFSSQNKAYVFQDITDNNPIEIQPGNNVRLDDPNRYNKLSFSGNDIFLYSGPTSGGEGEGKVVEGSSPQSTEPVTTHLFEYNSKGALTKTIHPPADLRAQGIYKLSGTFFVIDFAYGFGFYRLDKDNLNYVYQINNMGTWAIVKNKAYVESGGTLYEFTAGEKDNFSLRSVYASSLITVSGLYTTPLGLVFTGLADTSINAPLNIYQLTDKADDGSTERATEPAYLGLNTLLEYGVSNYQLENMRHALSNYAQTTPTPITFIGITNADTQHDRFSTSTTDTVTFTATTDQKTKLSGKLEYFDLSGIRLLLFDSTTGNQVFDSGVINHRQP